MEPCPSASTRPAPGSRVVVTCQACTTATVLAEPHAARQAPAAQASAARHAFLVALTSGGGTVLDRHVDGLFPGRCRGRGPGRPDGQDRSVRGERLDLAASADGQHLAARRQRGKLPPCARRACRGPPLVRRTAPVPPRRRDRTTRIAPGFPRFAVPRTVASARSARGPGGHDGGRRPGAGRQQRHQAPVGRGQAQHRHGLAGQGGGQRRACLARQRPDSKATSPLPRPWCRHRPSRPFSWAERDRRQSAQPACPPCRRAGHRPRPGHRGPPWNRRTVTARPHRERGR